jgi:hypothetical protein
MSCLCALPVEVERPACKEIRVWWLSSDAAAVKVAALTSVEFLMASTMKPGEMPVRLSWASCQDLIGEQWLNQTAYRSSPFTAGRRQPAGRRSLRCASQAGLKSATTSGATFPAPASTR